MNAGGAARDLGQRLRLLVLSQPNVTDLCHGGGLRMHHLLRHLLQRHEVRLLCSEAFAPAPPVQGKLGRLLAMLRLGRPYCFQPDFQQAVDRQLAGPFDAVLVFGAELLQYLQNVEIPVVADLVDEPVLATLRELPALHGIDYLRMLKHALSLVPYERRWCRRTAACLLVSERDVRALERVTGSVGAVALPNGVDTGYFHPQGKPAVGEDLVFSGNMSFPPNVAGCLYFAREVFPLIQQEHPAARWTIVGADPHPSVRALSTQPGITVTGRVPDIRPFLGRAAVVISPMISGGGIKNKVLEAWAMKKGIVATSLGCAGVEARHEGNLLVANDAAGFAAQTVRLLRDQPLARALGDAGYRTVAAHYAWPDKAAKLEAILLSTVAQAEGARQAASPNSMGKQEPGGTPASDAWIGRASARP